MITLRMLDTYWFYKYLDACGIKRGSGGYNSVVHPHTGDTFKHWLAKCIVSKVLDDSGFRFYTEKSIGDKLVDVFVVDNFTAYEIETNKAKDYEESVLPRLNFYSLHPECGCTSNLKFKLVVFNLKELPQNQDDLIKYFKNYFADVRMELLLKSPKERLKEVKYGDS